MRVGFIGVGNMGGPMARNLVAAGPPVAAPHQGRPQGGGCLPDGAAAGGA
ncbi:MAG: 3-hydroxyisobutyrate dehydrogenase, partial [Gammaproteobacteria bacterium]|nr:3-hydroxyisobutyrate dehydrogenase [Gammaproteobacteria bacterium]